MQLVPSEVSIYGIYFPPMLLAGILGASATVLTVLLLNRYRLSRFFYYPPLVFVSLSVIYTGLISIFLIPA